MNQLCDQICVWKISGGCKVNSLEAKRAGSQRLDAGWTRNANVTQDGKSHGTGCWAEGKEVSKSAPWCPNSSLDDVLTAIMLGYLRNSFFKKFLKSLSIEQGMSTAFGLSEEFVCS